MGMRPLPLGRSADLAVGQTVFAIGNPFGLDFTLTTGVVSALGRDVPGERGVVLRGAIQTDAAINPGNSGGPLLDSAGRVIGVNTAIFSPSGASAGIGFAVPIDAVARVVPQLISRGSYAPPALGVSGDARADAMLRASGAPPGVVVLDVAPGGPADRAGIRAAEMTPRGFVPGDVIEAVDGEAVATLDDLLAVLDRRRVGQEVTLTLRDGTRRREVTVALTAGG
jgi:S1-C subfamily serine protease